MFGDFCAALRMIPRTVVGVGLKVGDGGAADQRHAVENAVASLVDRVCAARFACVGNVAEVGRYRRRVLAADLHHERSQRAIVGAEPAHVVIVRREQDVLREKILIGEMLGSAEGFVDQPGGGRVVVPRPAELIRGVRDTAGLRAVLP